MYKLIAPFRPMRIAKIHIAKDADNLTPYCGRFLGFDFGLCSESGFEGDTPRIFTLEEIKNKEIICKKCLIAIK